MTIHLKAFLAIICLTIATTNMIEANVNKQDASTKHVTPPPNNIEHNDPDYQYSVTGLARYGEPKYKTTSLHFDYSNPNAPKGGNLELAQLGTYDNLFISSYIGTKAMELELTHTQLMYRSKDEPFSLYGLLAERVFIAKDKSYITYYLNKEAKFHDGQPITAEDVKFSFEKQRDEGRPAQRRFYGKIDRIEIKDPHTITLHFKKDEETGQYDAELPMIVSLMYILPKHQLEGKSLKGLGMTKIIGSGPYEIDSYEQGRFIKYRRVKDHWAENLLPYKGQHNFDTIRYTYYKNKQSMVQAIMSGDVYYHEETDIKAWKSNLNGAAVNSGQLVKIEREHQLPVPVRTMIFNMHDEIFADKRTRQALSYALDFNTMNKILFDNGFHRMTSLFANTGLGFSGPASAAERKVLEPYMDKIDPAILESILNLPNTPGNGTLGETRQQVEELLQEAGWILKNGTRVHKDTGKPLTFVFLVRDQYLEKIALMYKETLKKFFGINIEIRKVGVVQYENMVINRKFGMIIHTWYNSRSPGNEQAYYFSVKAADVDGSSNYIGVKNPMLESLAAKIPLAETVEEMQATVKAFDRVVLNEWLMIPLAYDNKQRFLYWKSKIVMADYKEDAGVMPIRCSWAASEQFENKKSNTSEPTSYTDSKSDNQKHKSWLDKTINWLNEKFS